MADDTRKDGKASEPQYESRLIEEPHYIAPETPRPKRKKPMHAYPETQAGKMWKTLQREEPVNTMPGGMVNTAGGRPKEISWRDAFNFGEGSFLADLSKIPKTPCARDSLLVGLAAGGGLGGTSFVLTGMPKLLRSCHIAVVACLVGSVGNYYWCDQRRREEQRGIALALQGLKLYNERRAKEENAEKLKAIAEQAKLREERINKKSWYSIW